MGVEKLPFLGVRFCQLFASFGFKINSTTRYRGYSHTGNEHFTMSGETPLTVIGNLTSDPELRYTQAGLAVVEFTIASTPKRFDRSKNEWVDGDTLFMRASVWRDYAEHVAESLVKGARVLVVGTLRQENWEDKEGAKRSTLRLAVDEIGPSLRYATAVVHRIAREGLTPPGAWVQSDTVESSSVEAGQLIPA